MTKGFYAAFAISAYLLFFAAFLYLIGFVGNFPFLPKTIDSPAVSGPFPAFVINLSLIAIFGLQHSIMARQSFKQALAHIVPKPVERSIYVLASTIVLIVLLVFWQPIAGNLWRVDNGVVSTLLWAVFAIGWLIVLLSTFLLNHFELFGLQQVYLHARARTPATPKLRQPLFYKMVRHPLYSGFVIAFWATPHMTLGHLLLAVGMSVYILIGIHYEERDMVDLFGADYERYRERVGMLSPRLRKPAGHS